MKTPDYQLDRKIEHVYTLQAYLELVKKPVNKKNCEKLLELQNQRIHALMVRAWDVPFYRERFERSHTTPEDYHCAEDLYKFPLLTKDELREWYDTEERENPEKYQYWHISPTSGSTGQPLRMLYSPRENAWVQANWMRVLTLPGYNPFTGKTMCRPNTLHDAAAKEDSPIQRLGILRRQSMSDTSSAQVPTPDLIEEINAYQPDFLYNHKNVLVRIAKYAKENNVKVWQPRFYAPISEQMDEPSKQLLLEVFGPGLVNAYGLNEVGSCVEQMPGKRYAQVHSDTHVVNIYNKELTGPAKCGPAVMTSLYKTDLPVINYISGDNMDTFISHGLRFVKSIQGRANDAILMKDGSQVSWANVMATMNHTPEVVQYRFIQEDYEKLTILLVRNPAVPESEQAAVEKRMSDSLNLILKGAFVLDYHWMEEIPSDPTGKLRVIVCKIPKELRK